MTGYSRGIGECSFAEGTCYVGALMHTRVQVLVKLSILAGCVQVRDGGWVREEDSVPCEGCWRSGISAGTGHSNAPNDRQHPRAAQRPSGWGSLDCMSHSSSDDDHTGPYDRHRLPDCKTRRYKSRTRRWEPSDREHSYVGQTLHECQMFDHKSRIRTWLQLPQSMRGSNRD